MITKKTTENLKRAVAESQKIISVSEITDDHAKEFADTIQENPLHIIAVFRGQPEYKKGPDQKKIKWYLSKTENYLWLFKKGYNVTEYIS